MTAVLNDYDRKVLDVLDQAARGGLPCPTNFDIAEKVDCNHKTAITVVARLKAKGLIAIEGTVNAREITIVESGARTAMSRRCNRRIHHDNEDNVTRKPAAILTSHTPCFRCGARPDACACSHRRAMA